MFGMNTASEMVSSAMAGTAEGIDKDDAIHGWM